MLKDELEIIPECCFKCKFSRSCISGPKVLETRCHKLPPRVSGGRGIFPIVNPNSWCGSYKEKSDA